mmetsp:Transcript_17918/g.32705  ORF Transcript_17918/g.32705 Transcript_17918/m.32705 type:complete len:202 (-) Transcript_17918:302-907(-)
MCARDRARTRVALHRVSRFRHLRKLQAGSQPIPSPPPPADAWHGGRDAATTHRRGAEEAGREPATHHDVGGPRVLVHRRQLPEHALPEAEAAVPTHHHVREKGGRGMRHVQDHLDVAQSSRERVHRNGLSRAEMPGAEKPIATGGESTGGAAQAGLSSHVESASARLIRGGGGGGRGEEIGKRKERDGGAHNKVRRLLYRV